MCDKKEFGAGMAGGTRMALQYPPSCQISTALVHKSSQLVPTTQCWPGCLDTISQRPEVHTSHVRSKFCATLSRPSIVLSGSCRGILEPHAFRTLACQPYSITQGAALLVKGSDTVLFLCLSAGTASTVPETGSMDWIPNLVFLKSITKLDNSQRLLRMCAVVMLHRHCECHSRAHGACLHMPLWQACSVACSSKERSGNASHH